MEQNRRKGFTLAELLIVVAIIAVLVAISIPIFNKQLEKSREATDAANLRCAYASASVALLDSDGTVTGSSAGPVQAVQTIQGFGTDVKNTEIGGVKLSTMTGIKKGVSYYVNVSRSGEVTITINPSTGYLLVDPLTGEPK